MKNPLIKICGITSEEEIRYIAKAGIDYAGFVLFFPKSKRNLSLECAKKLIAKLPAGVVSSCRIPVFKAFNVSDMDAFSHYEEMDEVAGFVMDAAVPGSGKTFDWDLLQKLPSTEKQVLLAGGLNPDNVGEALTACAGKIDGVDTSSGVERTDGNGKSKERIEAFVRVVRGSSEK